MSRRIPSVCLVGTAPPRQCGIATFTEDLRAALGAIGPERRVTQVALTNPGMVHRYPPTVVYEVNAGQVSDYRAAAEFVNSVDVDVICVQHEFGIFGGPLGRHLLALLDLVHQPVVTTLHTVLPHPGVELRDALRAVAARSDRVVVLADLAVRMLVDEYGVDARKVMMIPHGVPDQPLGDPEQAKASVGLQGRTVLSTFGLLGPDKGIEDVIDALPAVTAAHPEVVYVVLGATHPEVRRTAGESYRHTLERQVDRLGLRDHVLFEDRYVTLEELCRALRATDIYVTPYRSTDQIVSGTLAYALSAGCVVVSTDFAYAREVLAGGRGQLVPMNDPTTLATAVIDLLDQPQRRAAMRRHAYDSTREMVWPAVARRYDELFTDVLHTRTVTTAAWQATELPAVNLNHLRALTDDTGLAQHAAHAVPHPRHGYCTDDVGRALVVVARCLAQEHDEVSTRLASRYLSFLLGAQRDDGRFDNLMTYDRQFVPDSASGDTLGQALWGLGELLAVTSDEAWRRLTLQMIERALPAAAQLDECRPMAYAISGLYGFLQRFPGALEVRRTAHALGQRLADRLGDQRRDDWTWFEPELTYANARLPHALLLAGRIANRDDWTDAALDALNFLIEVTWVPINPNGGYFDFVGNDGWYPHAGPRAEFGQQPIEAGYTADACMAAYELTGHDRYLEMGTAAAAWLLGRNRLGRPLYDPDTGRCADGLDGHGVNDNAGAESTLCALLALLAVPRVRRIEPTAAQTSAD
jgi:glycosyltransferase involved in cell wall biosynthesis